MPVVGQSPRTLLVAGHVSRSVTHNRLRGVLLIERLQTGAGGGQSFTGFPLGVGQLLPSLLDVFGLVISHGPTIRPGRLPFVDLALVMTEGHHGRVDAHVAPDVGEAQTAPSLSPRGGE